MFEFNRHSSSALILPGSELRIQNLAAALQSEHVTDLVDKISKAYPLGEDPVGYFDPDPAPYEKTVLDILDSAEKWLKVNGYDSCYRKTVQIGGVLEVEVIVIPPGSDTELAQFAADLERECECAYTCCRYDLCMDVSPNFVVSEAKRPISAEIRPSFARGYGGVQQRSRRAGETFRLGACRIRASTLKRPRVNSEKSLGIDLLIRD